MMMLSGSSSPSTFVNAQQKLEDATYTYDGVDIDQAVLAMAENGGLPLPLRSNSSFKTHNRHRSLQSKNSSPKSGGKCKSDNERRRKRNRRLNDDMSQQRAALRKGGPSGSEHADSGSKWQQTRHQAQTDATLRDENGVVRRLSHKKGRRLSHSKRDDECDDGGDGCFPADAIVEIWDAESQSFEPTKIKDAAVCQIVHSFFNNSCKLLTSQSNILIYSCFILSIDWR